MKPKKIVYLVQRLCSKNDVNGNPKRVYIVINPETGNIVDAIDEGYSGLSGVRKKYPEFIELYDVVTTNSEYKAFLKDFKKER